MSGEKVIGTSFRQHDEAAWRLSHLCGCFFLSDASPALHSPVSPLTSTMKRLLAVKTWPVAEPCQWGWTLGAARRGERDRQVELDAEAGSCRCPEQYRISAQ